MNCKVYKEHGARAWDRVSSFTWLKESGAWGRRQEEGEEAGKKIPPDY